MAFIAANIKPGDYVICPILNFVATSNLLNLLGAKIIADDVDKNQCSKCK